MEPISGVKKKIAEEGFTSTIDSLWLTPGGAQAIWTFDLKSLLLEKEFLGMVSSLFWDIFDKTKPIQIGGLETASIPLITALVMSGDKATGFYIRKSRKKKYDLRQMEGRLGNSPIVLVDDVINQGLSIEKQIKVLKEYDRDVSGVFVLVRLRDTAHYSFFKDYGIKFHSLFNVTDFGRPYIKESISKQKITFTEKWSYRSECPHLFNVTHRKQSLICNEIVYLNNDDGYVYAFSKGEGIKLWQTRVHRKVPNILNQPGLVCNNDELYVPSENGTVYSLRSKTGEVTWKSCIADHIYDQPSISKKSRKLIINSIDGGLRKVIVCDTNSGHKVWEYSEGKAVVWHKLAREGSLLIVSSGDGYIKCFHLNSGNCLWVQKVSGGLRDCVTVQGSKIFFVTDTSFLYIMCLNTGSILKEINVTEEYWLSATPLIKENKAYITSLHRTVYCVDLNSEKIIWEIDTRGRIFGQPIISKGGTLFIGNNEGIVYAIDSNSGELQGKHMLTERIVANPFYCENTKTLFVETIAGEIYALQIAAG